MGWGRATKYCFGFSYQAFQVARQVLFSCVTCKAVIGCEYAFADKPGSYGGDAYGFRSGRPVGRLAFDCDLDFDFSCPVERPSGGFAQWVNRQGCRFSRAGPRMGHRGDPRSRTGARHRTSGARALGYLGPGGVPFFQVTRCKSETIGGRYRRNGYVRGQENPGWLLGRHRWQASSYSGFGCIRK